MSVCHINLTDVVSRRVFRAWNAQGKMRSRPALLQTPLRELIKRCFKPPPYSWWRETLARRRTAYHALGLLALSAISDWKEFKAFIWRSIRAAFYTPDSSSDFEKVHVVSRLSAVRGILESPGNVLEQLLPHALPRSYDSRKRPHTKQIPNRCPYLTDCNFITKMLFSDIYWLMLLVSSVLCLNTYTWILYA